MLWFYGAVLQALKLSLEVQRNCFIENELACCQKIISKYLLFKAKKEVENSS